MNIWNPKAKTWEDNNNIWNPQKKKWETPASTTKNTVTTPQLDDTELHTQAERNIVQKYGTYEQFAAKQSKGKVVTDITNKTSQTLYQQLIEEEKKRLASGSEFYGITNKGYQEYLDNFSKNAKDENQTAWLGQQRKNLEFLKDSDTRAKVEKAVFSKKTSFGVGKKKMIYALSKELDITYEQAESLYDTVEREQNAEHSKTLEENADNLTEKGFLGKATAHFLSIGANIASTLGILDSIGDSAENKITGKYAPIDTNASGYAAGNFRDRARGNIEADIVGEEGEDAPLWRKGLGTIYQGASSAFDSLGQGLVLGPTGAMLAMGGQAATGATKEAFERTVSNSKAITTGLVSGGIEALTEKMGLDNMWDILQNSGKAALRSTLVNILAQSGIEGVEEMTSEALNTVADYLINQTDSNISKSAEEHKESGLSDKEAWKKAFSDAAKQVGKAGLTGAVAGIFGGAAGSALSTSYSKNEKQVIEKEVERRISEKQGKVTAKEKAEIRKEVQKDLEKGYIDIDTIESTLGGKTYDSYQNLSKEMEEYQSLNKMKAMEMTGEQSDRLAELKEKNKKASYESEQARLKEQLSKEVSDITVNDRFLRESYNEKGRRSQAFEADVNTYDEKQRAIIQNAIDSGILNNTRRTHEFVDMIAKISADKGVSFDFTDNQRLKESGFAKEGVSVNGYIKDGRVTLNVNSAKALNKVVGHEITHVMEGSDLYAELQEAVKAYATTKGEYKSKLEAITKLYEGVEGANVEQELTADLIGEYLFTDEAFVQQLSVQNRNVFQKIYDEIKYLCKVVSSGSKEAKQLEKVKRAFEKAYKETAKDTNNRNKVQYDISEDTELYQYIQDSLNGKLSKKSSYDLSDSISERLAKDIESILGFSIEGYRNQISPGNIEHINKEHGIDGRSDKSMSDLHDLAKIRYVIENYDNLREGKVSRQYKNSDGSLAKTIELQKKIDDKFYYVVEAVPDAKSKSLHVVSAYINKNDTFSEVAVSEDPSRYVQDELQTNVSSNNSISQNQQKTTENQKFSLGEDDIAPTTGWNVKGSDIVLDDTTPIRKDIAPAQKEEVQQETSKQVKATEETEKFSRSKYHKSLIDKMKVKFEERGYDFDEVLNNARNKSTWASVDNTPQRFMEKTLGYKEGQILSDLTVNQTAQNESKAIQWLNSYTDRKKGFLAQISKQYGIKPGSKESAAAQMYGEGFYVNEAGDYVEYTDTELAKDFPDPVKQKNIKALAKDPRIRQVYDETLDQINESRKRNGYPEIPRRKDYFLHFHVMEDAFSRLGIPFNPNDIKAKDLPTDINGVTADLKPGQPYFASSMQRKGNRTTYDLLGGLERYLGSAKNQIFHIDDIQNLRALRNYIADTYGQAKGLEKLDEMTEEEAAYRIEQVYKSHLSTFAKFLNEQANTLAGKTSLIDRGLEGIIGRKGITFLDTVNKQVGSNLVGLNLSSGLTNLDPAIKAIAKGNKFDAMKSLAQTIANKIGSITGHPLDDFTEINPLCIRRKGADKFARTPYDKVKDASFVFAGLIDNISTEFIVRTKYNELTRKGMDEYQAHIEADKWASRILGDRSYGQQPQLYNAKMLGLLTKFQLEVRNNLDSMFYDTIQETKASKEDIQNKLERNSKIAVKVTSSLVQLAVFSHLFGAALESLVGYNPTLDFIEVLATVFGFDDEEDSEDTVLDNVEQGFLALLEDLPYTSTFTGGRIPIASALPIQELITGTDQYGNEKSRVQTAAEALPYYLLPAGYGQVKKSIQGIKMFDDDLPIAGSYTNNGIFDFLDPENADKKKKLRFTVDDDIPTRVKAAVFGQYANKNAREYFDEGRTPLSEKKTQELADLDIPISEYWDIRDGLKEHKKLADKIDYVAGLDLPIAKKNILANNLTDRKEPIDLTDYDLYGNIEELDFATSNPEKYKVAKAVGGYSSYKTYTKALNNIKANKDKNGKTISGSRKTKVVNYLNGLSADYGTKLILFKREFPGDDTYNKAIVEYLNKRSDLSYSDVEIILKELGFTVDSKGTMRW